jgi:hypothetical protein
MLDIGGQLCVEILYIITTVCLSVCPSVRLSVRRRFRVLIDVVEPARTVGFGKPDSARTVGFGKRVPGFGKTGGQTGQGGAGGRAGSICPSVLQGRGQGCAGRAGAK